MPSSSSSGILHPTFSSDERSKRSGENAERKRRSLSSLSSLSLASLKGSSRRNAAPESKVDGAATTPCSPTSSNFNSRGKLRRLLRLAPASGTFSTKSRPLEPRPAFSSVYATPPPSPRRSSSRGRSHSAPLLLAHASPFAANAATTPFFTTQTNQGDFDHPGSETSSLTGSPFCTAISSPVSVSVPPSPALGAEAVAAPPPDLFAHYLPHELQLRVMKAVLDVHEEDWRREVRDRRWKGEKARERWNDGKGRGRKDLVRLGRVSKAWRQLSLDGQLWETAPASSLIGADALSSEAVTRLMDQSGAYVKTLDAKGMHKSLDWKTLERAVEGARAFQLEGSTNFTTIDLAGCTSLTASSVTSLLAHSPHLASLSLYALRMVNSSHMITLGSTCPRLVSLNVARCPHVHAPSLLALPYPPKRSSSAGSTATMRSRRGLKALKAAYLPGMDDDTLVALLERHEELEVLDVTFNSQLTDAAFQRITTPPAPARAAALDDSSSAGSPARRRWIRPSQTPSPLITTSIVPPPAPSPPAQRILSTIRHLNLSGCSGLTSLALSHLAGSLPSLEFLELSRLTSSLRSDDHVARLLLHSPKLRKLDLEDASELGDEVLRALLPTADDDVSPLEHLVINGCTTFSDLAISDVVHACANLRVLEADGTAVTDRTSREFVNLSRPRLLAAQAAAAARAPDNPLAAMQTPGILSILDNRLTGRRLSREVGTLIRPRTGQRGWWTRAVGFYHDEDDEDETEGDNHDGRGGGRDRPWKATHLSECDPERIAVRSFYSSLAVDAANALREAKAGGAPGGGALRGRALSDSVVRLGWGGDEDEAGSVGCVVS
ncbi:hypothetical protein JCM1841_000148 [Sporobolomyces salmonicolor]